MITSTRTYVITAVTKSANVALLLSTQRRPAELPSVMTRLTISLHPLGACINSNDKLIMFMHFHNFCTCYGDHVILLIKTNNAHKKDIVTSYQ